MFTHQRASAPIFRPSKPSQNSRVRRESKKHPAKLVSTAVLALVAGLALSGCASGFNAHVPSREGAKIEKNATPLPTPYLVSYDEPIEDAAPRPLGDLTLSQAISLSIERNPELQAFAWDAKGAVARIRQARLWPNPELEFERENFGGTGTFSGSASAESTLSLAQNLPLGGDIKQRRRLAELESQLADWDYHAARLDTLVEVTQRFVAALAADRRLEFAEQALELARSIEKLTTSRVEAGDASPLELTRAVVPVVTAELSLAQTERARKAAYRLLSLSWGGRVTTFDKVVGDLDAVSPTPTPEALIQHINDNPEVARWTIEISARIAEGRLAKAEAIPNLTGRFGLRRDRESGDEALVVGLSLPLPLFDRSQGQIQAARMGEASARSRKRAAELRIESLLNRAYAELADAHDEALAIRDRALPAADRAYQGTQLAFKEGKLPFLDVLDAKRTLFELQQRYLDSLVAYHFQTAAIESIIGRSLADLKK